MCSQCFLFSGTRHFVKNKSGFGCWGNRAPLSCIVTEIEEMGRLWVPGMDSFKLSVTQVLIQDPFVCSPSRQMEPSTCAMSANEPLTSHTMEKITPFYTTPLSFFTAQGGRLFPSHSMFFSLWLSLLKNAEWQSRDLLTWQQRRNVWILWFKPSGNTGCVTVTGLLSGSDRLTVAMEQASSLIALMIKASDVMTNGSD